MFGGVHRFPEQMEQKGVAETIYMPPCVLSQVMTNPALPETVGTLLGGAADMVDDQKSTNRAFVCCSSFVPEWKWEVLGFAFFFSLCML